MKKNRSDEQLNQIERELRKQDEEKAAGSAYIPRFEMVPVKKPIKKKK